MRLTIALAFVPLAVAVIHADARATGLRASLSPSDGSLGRLDSLSVDVRLGPTAAEITQQRSYTLNSMYAGATVELTFYDSVAGPAGTAAPAITINGLPATGTTLAVADADAARRQLTRLLGDPTALRGLGTPLYATDAMVVQVPTTNVIDVRITTTVPLATLGTMRGLVVPLDWSRLPVAKVDVKVTATTAAPLRALYSPYHELQVVRDGVDAAHASYTGRNVCTDFDLTLLVSSGDGLVHLDLLPFRYGAGEGGYFLALVTPDPTPAVSNVLPRDLVFVLDTSGSMSGAKMTQAKEALRGVLQGLRPIDSFSLVTFSDAVRTFPIHICGRERRRQRGQRRRRRRLRRRPAGRGRHQHLRRPQDGAGHAAGRDGPPPLRRVPDRRRADGRDHRHRRHRHDGADQQRGDRRAPVQLRHRQRREHRAARSARARFRRRRHLHPPGPVGRRGGAGVLAAARGSGAVRPRPSISARSPPPICSPT